MGAADSAGPSVHRARELLGVAADADAAQLAHAYRRQARRLHPDVSAEPDATEQFWALQAAYRVALAAASRPARQTPARAATQAPGPQDVSPGRRHVGRPGASEVEWLAAGPVHVRPPQQPPTPSTSQGDGQ